VSTLERIQAALPGTTLRPIPSRDGILALEVEREDYPGFMRGLHDLAAFETNTFVTAVDHFPREPRYELCVQLASLHHEDRVRVHVRLGGAEPSIATITDLWPGAAYSERECWDMFGIRFEGHAGLKRLLMPEDYEYFPLRKDFPHQGIEPDRLYRAWERARARPKARS
jgi:NADH-quinone oxidoreductase subunit C